jgi:hypothetical protein
MSIVVCGIRCEGGFCHESRAHEALTRSVERGEPAQPARASDGRVTGHRHPRRDVADDAALCGDTRPLSDGDVVGDAHLASHENPRAHGDRSGKARLGRDESPGTDVAVVPDVNLRVDLRSAPNDRGDENARVDGAQRADVHVILDDDAAEVRHLLDRTVRAGGPSEAAAADDTRGADVNAMADHDALPERDMLAERDRLAELGRERRHDGAFFEQLGHRPGGVGVNPAAQPCDAPVVEELGLHEQRRSARDRVDGGTNEPTGQEGREIPVPRAIDRDESPDLTRAIRSRFAFMACDDLSQRRGAEEYDAVPGHGALEIQGFAAGGAGAA